MQGSNKLNRLILLFFLIAAGYVLLTFAYTLFQPLRTDDTFWHLKIGEILCTEKTFPQKDPLLFTSSGFSPLYHEWLFQVVLSGIEKTFGLYSLRFFHLILGFSILGLLWKLSRYFLDSTLLRFNACLIFILFSFQRLIQLRPELFTILFFLSLVLLFLNNFRLSVKCLMAFFICLAGSNMHSLFLIIFPFLVIWTLLSLNRNNLFPLGSGLLASCFNPMGLNFFLFYWVGDARNPYQDVIDEWGHFNPLGMTDFLPLSSPVLILGYVVLIIITLWGIKSLKQENVLSSPKTHLFLHLSALLSLGLMGFAVRFFWLSFFPILFSLSLMEKSQVLKNTLKKILFLGILSSMYLYHFFLPSTGIYSFPWDPPSLLRSYFLWSVDRVKYNAGAAEFLKNSKIQGKIFNPYYMGGYLSYVLNPDCKMFIDGRFEHYSRKVNGDYYLILSGSKDFSRLIRDYGIDYLFLPHECDSEELDSALEKNAFPKIYEDSLTRIYKVRKG